ncbi:hypothetical protein BDK51DRAFT_42819 [Blyttiomyces helicus]|uniref:Uncharacterized protein n=1 Tax=Blyttiomyces helicus TaxID=388810 RepID=A0A4P9W7C2_9FUNG|nr:hypothetical protein BDK51DRAFT_42819 [Blyttiomyces helicus]|eukprot:RKO88254.1 hypothetical protein BDK51DRAFT_42819 [Blyttiomyces helicus]
MSTGSVESSLKLASCRAGSVEVSWVLHAAPPPRAVDSRLNSHEANVAGVGAEQGDYNQRLLRILHPADRAWASAVVQRRLPAPLQYVDIRLATLSFKVEPTIRIGVALAVGRASSPAKLRSAKEKGQLWAQDKSGSRNRMCIRRIRFCASPFGPSPNGLLGQMMPTSAASADFGMGGLGCLKTLHSRPLSLSYEAPTPLISGIDVGLW